LRHALKALEGMGVLTQRVGDGTYLTHDSELILREPLDLLILIDRISLDDLLETRLIVEPELASRAAERATVEDLEQMRESLAAMQREKDNAKLIEADLGFHQAIFLAARNTVCKRIFSLIHRAMMTSIGVTSRLVDGNHTLAFHRPIYDGIEKRQADQARAAMTDHLLDARRLLGSAANRGKRIDVTGAIRPIAGATRRGARR
jgi:GntR family transcriptional repressor for pyruvate dehydrogenase complex